MQWHEQRFHEDPRRRGFYDIIPGLPGDVNFSHMPTGAICGLHMHTRQTDYFAVAKGSLLIRLIYEDGRPEEKFIISQDTGKTLIIPPGVWHGYKALEPTTLVFYIDKKYSTDDEHRRPTDPKDWEIEIK